MKFCIKFKEKTSLLVMLAMTSLFFFAEIITGYYTNSMALIADSFHMLSDVLSIIIAYIAVHFSGKTTAKNTYNWARSETLGAMVNTVFLMALCFTIFVDAIQRLITVEVVDQPLLVLGVGVAGIVINIIGLVLFGGHIGHSHGHSHDHGHGHGHSHDHGHSHVQTQKHKIHTDESRHIAIKNDESMEHAGSDCEHGKVSTITSVSLDHEMEKLSQEIEIVDKESQVVVGKQHHGDQLNMKAAFVHVLGDALGSLVVIISALIIHFAEGDWRYYMDPAMSLIIVVIICWTTIPLLIHAGMILLQNPPSGINIQSLKNKVNSVPGILGLHDLHVWQLSSKCIIATLHIVIKPSEDFVRIAKNLKTIFHNAGVHATTIQPEVIEENMNMVESAFTDGEITVTSSSTDEHCSSLTVKEEQYELDKAICLFACELESCKEYVCCPTSHKEIISDHPTAFENKTFFALNPK